MLLEKKNAIIYGAGGAIGGAVARAFAREGAKVFLAGRTLASLEAVAKDISNAGGVAEITQVDAFDQRAIENYLAEVANTAILMASDYASAMTGAVANVTCGEIVD